MTPKNEKYWAKRRDLEDKARLKMEDKTIKSILDCLPGALEKIQEKLLSQADLHDMTLPELLEDFSLRDQKKYRKYIDENYKELMKSDDKYQEFIDEYFPKYDYAKVNRLLQIRTDIFKTLADDMIKNKSTEKLHSGLEDIVTRMYNSNSNVFMSILGPGDYNALSKQDLENMLNYPWSGKTFSNRLWGNISRLEQNLSKAIVDSVQSGNGVLEALQTMKNDSSISDMFKLEEGKFNRAITNLVRTEYSHFSVEGLRKSVNDAGIDQLQSWSAEDERVCDICGTGKDGRHGKLITDGWYPPYHGRCRCTAIPKMPELDESIDREHEEMFGDLLDEFANDKFGIKLNHPTKKENNDDLLRNIDMKTASINDIISIGKSFSEKHDIVNLIGDKEKLAEAFSEYREMGAEIPKNRWFARSNKVVKGQIEEAFSNYPKEWGKLFEQSNKKIFAGKTRRGFFSRYLIKANGYRLLAGAKEGEGVSIYADGLRKRTAYHEIGHLMEYLNPNLLRLSKEFVSKRTVDEKPIKLSKLFPGAGYSSNEVTKKDNFISPYIGKEYPNATEVLSVGLESIFEPGDGHIKEIDKNRNRIYSKISDDPEFLHFIVGILLKG